MSRPLFAVLILLIIASTATAVFATYSGGPGSLLANRDALAALKPVPPRISHTPIREPLPIRSGDTLQDVIGRAGLDSTVNEMIIQAITESFDVRKLRAGNAMFLTRDTLRTPIQVEYQIDSDHMLEVAGHGDGFVGRVKEIPSRVDTIPVCAKLNGSLFQSIEEAGENPELAIRIAEIFAWDLDFYTDPQPGDDFCVLVEKKTYQFDQPPTYGKILAATYDNAGTIHDAFLFPDKEGKPTYYSSDGKSTQAAFLRSPLKFAARISSRFTHSRFHPVLKIRRPHLGTDYAAPTGTPVQAVASGRVTFSGRSGGAGNLVKIQHSNGFETYYMHLSRRSVRVGQRVDQGAQIGLVGATGLATGPHLDFRIRKNGRYMDFERLKLPKEKEIDPSRIEDFRTVRGEYLASMQSDNAPAGAVVASAAKPAEEE